MCTTANEPLTLAELLVDPLTRLVMRSDGVTEEDFVELWLRIQSCRTAGTEVLVPA